MKNIYLLIILFAVSACTYTMRVQDGRMAVDRKQYAVAVDMLQKEYRKAKSRVEKGKLAFQLGESYTALQQSESAIEWYKIAYDNQYGIEAQEKYAYALKQAERYEEAMQAFRDLGLEIGSPYEYRREIQASLIAREWKQQDRGEYRISPADFNSAAADYAPVLYTNDRMIITSDRGGTAGDDTYAWTGNAFADLFVVDLKSGAIESFADNLNSPANEGTAAFDPSFQEVYFNRCDGEKREDAFCKIMFSKIGPDGSWSTPQALSFMEEGVNYLHPALSANGQRLYFSSNHSDGWGGYDIYVTERLADGSWDAPTLMGRSVNTIYDEQFPYLDNDTLYFASNGHTGMGGLDLFKTYQIKANRWSAAQNLLPPINSGNDDFGIVFTNEQSSDPTVLRTGYFTSRRFDGMGGDDIYRFEKVIPPPAPVEEMPEIVVGKLLLDVFVLEKIFVDPTNPNSRLLGRKPLAGAVLTVKRPDGKTEEVILDDTGQFSLEIEPDQQYQFLAKADTYLSNEAVFDGDGLSLPTDRPELRYELEIVLDKIYLDKEITLENIYYDFDKANIREDAKPTLDELANLLQLNADIRIQLGSHTDCQGPVRYNEELSQRRAQSAVDYLISKGIAPDRLRARGYGEGSPAVDCVCARCSDDEHQANRRTTFQILE